ncbi:MAG: YesL family protein [Lawsonibacter sp.]|nr:YesL family protein [Lawsonibacter sp.]MCI8989806.1 YesL family protein [Lawsonibacter sp.]MCI9267592.1 YesL family protein [Lawsonibacter sp.]
MGEFFNPEKGIWAWLSTLVDVVGLSVLWIALCLPVVTIGPATAALYYAVVRYVRRRESGAFGGYLRSFRANFAVGLRATLTVIPLFLLLLGGYRIVCWYGTRLGGMAYILYVAYYFALVLPAGVVCWLFPLLGRFEYGVRDLFRTAFQLTAAHLPSTVILVLLTGQSAVFCLNRWWPVVFLPSVGMLLASLFTERIFCKYSPELAAEEREEPEE